MTVAKPNDRTLLSPVQAARALGWDDPRGEKLKRIVFTWEEKHKRELFIRNGSKAKPSYRITLATLRKHFRTAFDRSKVEALHVNLEPYMRQVTAKLRESVEDQIAESVAPQLEELHQMLKTLYSRVIVLEKALK